MTDVSWKPGAVLAALIVTATAAAITFSIFACVAGAYFYPRVAVGIVALAVIGALLWYFFPRELTAKPHRLSQH
jgi:hypothetical protein